jgi:hypothetical protein
MNAIVRFPAERVPRAAAVGATRVDILKGRLRERLGRLLNRMGAPGVIRDMEVNDKAAGHTVAVAVGDLFVKLTVNGRDYYFDRVTGRFDGTGSVP